MVEILLPEAGAEGKVKEDCFRHVECISTPLGPCEFSAWPWLFGQWYTILSQAIGEPKVKVPSQLSLSIKLLSSLWINTLRFPHVFYVSIFNEYLLAWVILPFSPIYIYSGASIFKFSETTTIIDIYFLGSKKTLSMPFGKTLFGVWLVKKWRHWNLILVWGPKRPFWKHNF